MSSLEGSASQSKRARKSELNDKNIQLIEIIGEYEKKFQAFDAIFQEIVESLKDKDNLNLSPEILQTIKELKEVDFIELAKWVVEYSTLKKEDEGVFRSGIMSFQLAVHNLNNHFQDTKKLVKQDDLQKLRSHFETLAKVWPICRKKLL